MIKYIHIGYPKNFSTSLQRDYFSKNPDIFHLGIGLGDNLGYYDDTIDKTFELYLKTCKTYLYGQRKKELQLHIEALCKKAESANCKAFGASSEHLSFNFTYDGLDAEVKINRLQELFGDNTRIIMLVRNQFDLIKSLFQESVRVGFKGDFSKYTYLLYKYQDRNYWSDLHYDWVYKKYCEAFGAANVFVLFFEDYRKKGSLVYDSQGEPKIFSDLNQILEIKTHGMKLGHYNEALTNNEIQAKIELNRDNAHDLGNHMYEAAEKHRLRKYFENDLNLFELNDETYSDVILKRKLIQEVKTETKKIEQDLFKYDTQIMERLVTDFIRSNIVLQNDLLKKSMPDDYFNMELRTKSNIAISNS